jgi:hypothetical protein
MARVDRILARVLSGTSDRNIRFSDVCSLLHTFGFEERVKGSHHIFMKDGVVEIINLQPLSGGQAKPYQVKQVRDIVVKYKLAEELEK